MADEQFTTEEIASEEWRPVAGHEGIYSVSNLGRVRSDRRAGNTYAGKILACPIRAGSYRYVTLGGTPARNPLVHRLIASAFLGPVPVGKQVNHIDGIKTNNRATNLEYVTPRENMQHAMRTGLRVERPWSISAREAHAIARPRVPLICEQCGNSFSVTLFNSKRRKHCSKKCSNTSFRGKTLNTGRTHFLKGRIPWNKKHDGLVNNSK